MLDRLLRKSVVCALVFKVQKCARYAVDPSDVDHILQIHNTKIHTRPSFVRGWDFFNASRRARREDIESEADTFYLDFFLFSPDFPPMHYPYHVPPDRFSDHTRSRRSARQSYLKISRTRPPSSRVRSTARQYTYVAKQTSQIRCFCQTYLYLPSDFEFFIQKTASNSVSISLRPHQ